MIRWIKVGGRFVGVAGGVLVAWGSVAVLGRFGGSFTSAGVSGDASGRWVSTAAMIGWMVVVVALVELRRSDMWLTLIPAVLLTYGYGGLFGLDGFLPGIPEVVRGELLASMGVGAVVATGLFWGWSLVRVWPRLKSL